jgi:hypothetical protein
MERKEASKKKERPTITSPVSACAIAVPRQSRRKGKEREKGKE